MPHPAKKSNLVPIPSSQDSGFYFTIFYYLHATCIISNANHSSTELTILQISFKILLNQTDKRDAKRFNFHFRSNSCRGLTHIQFPPGYPAPTKLQGPQPILMSDSVRNTVRLRNLNLGWCYLSRYRVRSTPYIRH